jgi:hypothetical protein
MAPASQSAKPDANGKAKRWHGYVAREGFGITRNRNHSIAKNPPIGNIHFSQRCFCLLLRGLHAFVQNDRSCFSPGDCIVRPSQV